MKIDANILFIKSNSNFERQFAGARDNRSFVNRLTDGASDYYYIYRAAWPDDEFLIRASDSPALCSPRHWLRGWDFCFCFCFPFPGPLSLPCYFYARPFSEEICRTVKYLFCPGGATGGSRLFCHRPASDARTAKISLIRVARVSLPFRAFRVFRSSPQPRVFPRPTEKLRSPVSGTRERGRASQLPLLAPCFSLRRIGFPINSRRSNIIFIFVN